MIKKIFSNATKDPGVLFSCLHTCAFGVSAGVTSLPFAGAAASLVTSISMNASDKFNKGTALITNGIFLTAIAATSAFTGNPAGILIGGAFSASNISKGLEMNGSSWSLKAIGEKLPEIDYLKAGVQNTLLSAEAWAAVGAFTAGYLGAGSNAAAGLICSAGALIVSAANNNNPENPFWKSCLPQRLTTFLERDQPISDMTASRYLTAGASITYAATSFLSAAQSGLFGPEQYADAAQSAVIAVGNVCAFRANSLLAGFMRAADQETIEAITSTALQSQSLDRPSHTPHPAPKS